MSPRLVRVAPVRLHRRRILAWRAQCRACGWRAAAHTLAAAVTIAHDHADLAHSTPND